jgi:hypothetical protein
LVNGLKDAGGVQRGRQDGNIRRKKEENSTMGESKEISGITVTYTDGSTKELQSGCCVDLEEVGNEMSVDMLNVEPTDIVRLALGLVVCVDRMGMIDMLREMLEQ